MSKVGEPMDLTKEINDIKTRLESLEQRLLSMSEGPLFGSQARSTKRREEVAFLKKGCER